MKSQQLPYQKTLTPPKTTTSKTQLPIAAIDLRSLFIAGLQDIYWAEKALTKAIPVMIKNAVSEELTAALKSHLEETKNQIGKLEEVFALVNEKASAKKCEAMDGLIQEGEELMDQTTQGAVRDAGIIAAAQKLEHYEIASYGTLAAFARTLGEEDAVMLLEEILEEEKEADVKLTQTAESFIHKMAMEMDEPDDDEDEPYEDDNDLDDDDEEDRFDDEDDDLADDDMEEDEYADGDYEDDEDGDIEDRHLFATKSKRK